MGANSVTCHPTQVNTSDLNPSLVQYPENICAKSFKVIDDDANQNFT